MVGAGNRRDDGSFTVGSTNVFAALETLRRRKKSDKGSTKGSKSSSETGAGKSKQGEEGKPVFWAPAPLTAKSWADVDDDDDDDYYATTAPPQAIWGGSGSNNAQETEKLDHLEESESEDELLDEGDDDVEEEPDHEIEVQEHLKPIANASVEASPAPKETERQLSKKERRKKELAELEAILADFGVNPKEKAEDETNDVNKDGKEGHVNGVAEKKDSAPAESKSAKKKKKKDKASKEVKESQDQPNSSDAPTELDETAGADDTSAVDMKERLKKVASKKKKSSKEVDGAARAAAMEAAARSAKLAAAKKKEKNHYNQQPIR